MTDQPYIPPPSAGDCIYVASILRDLREETPGLGRDPDDSEAAAIDRIAEFLQRLGGDRVE
jgi:hypothetical protein